MFPTQVRKVAAFGPFAAARLEARELALPAAPSFAVQLCPECRGSPALTRRKVNQALGKYSSPIIGGLLLRRK